MELWGWVMVVQGTQAPCTHLWYTKICFWQSCLVDNFPLQEGGCLDKEEVPCSPRVKPLIFSLLSTVWLPCMCRDLPQSSWAGIASSASQAPHAPYRVTFPKLHPHKKQGYPMFQLFTSPNSQKQCHVPGPGKVNTPIFHTAGTPGTSFRWSKQAAQPMTCLSARKWDVYVYPNWSWWMTLLLHLTAAWPI